MTADSLRGLRTELGIPEGVPVVGTIGRLVREKGYEDLLEAADLVRAVVPDVRLLLVGARGEEERDGFSRDEIAARKVWMVLTEWRTDIPALLALMDVFVLASWREGMPRSAIEAAAMARPLVLTDIRGCREVARNDVEGFLVPPRSPSKLAAVIALLLQDGGLRARMGEAARTRALESFDEKRVGDRVEDVYRQLLWKKGLLAVGGDSELRIRRARARDAAALARLHLETLPTAFLPKLGLGFLTVLYRALSRDAKAVVFVAENDGVVVGFAAAVPSVRLFYRSFYRRHGVRAGLAALPRLIRPRIVRHILQTARYPRVAGLLPDAELLSIAVAPSSQAKGVGRGLAEAVRRGLADP